MRTGAGRTPLATTPVDDPRSDTSAAVISSIQTKPANGLRQRSGGHCSFAAAPRAARSLLQQPDRAHHRSATQVRPVSASSGSMWQLPKAAPYQFGHVSAYIGATSSRTVHQFLILALVELARWVEYAPAQRRCDGLAAWRLLATRTADAPRVFDSQPARLLDAELPIGFKRHTLCGANLCGVKEWQLNKAGRAPRLDGSRREDIGVWAVQ